MSDLRTLLAWALYRATQQQDAYVENIEGYPGEPRIDGTTTVDGQIVFLDLADAVIRELRLEVERGSTYEIGGKATSYRYVTDWKADDE
jgi:hypothetical protein